MEPTLLLTSGPPLPLTVKWENNQSAPLASHPAGHSRSRKESLDGDDKELESSEEGGGGGGSGSGSAEDRKPEQPPSSHFCLYAYHGSRSPTQRGDSDDGSPGSLTLETPSAADFSLPDVRVGCYYCLFQQDKPLLERAAAELLPDPPEYIVCFLGGSEKGLELFRLELDKYIQGLKTNVDGEEGSLEACTKSYLSNWFEAAICPVQRVVHLFQEKLTFLLHAALSYTPVEVQEADEKTKRDINGFLSVASLQGLIHEGTMTSLCMAMTEELRKSVVINCSGTQPQFSNAGSNRFCEDWMQAFLNAAEGGNPFLFRQILENFKLKAIQDTNNLKRFIRQAEMNHYALFKCYLFLKNCGSGDILLKIVKVEHEEMPEAKNVILALEEFMKEAAVVQAS
ncbi:protein Njmu-R1 isoform X3 [Dromiciops gliroides]|uniref:protein Njmu-R1 isoform X3 n=1 Tax=Dromiciops gliroides TaxID=33562 RepID=UPI001CC6D1BC|nr:protein Njmu-R1 isoform X3 [Dromiciops gliroides]